MLRRKFYNPGVRRLRVHWIVIATTFCAIVGNSWNSRPLFSDEPIPWSVVDSGLIDSGLFEESVSDSGVSASGLSDAVHAKQKPAIKTASFVERRSSFHTSVVAPTAAESFDDESNLNEPTTRVIVGLPKVAKQVGRELRLQPNIRMDLEPAGTMAQGKSIRFTTASSQSMFLSRPIAAQEPTESQPKPTLDDYIIEEVQQDPFSFASRSSDPQSRQSRSSGPQRFVTSPPQNSWSDVRARFGFASEIEDLPPPLILKTEQNPGNDASNPDGESILGDASDLRNGFEAPISLSESSFDYPLTERFDGLAESSLVRNVRQSAGRLRSTRQRIDAGLGSILVANAPLVLDTTQPLKQYRFRGDFGYGNDFPDRSEYLWASPLKGPGYQGSIDTQEFAFMFELASEAASIQSEFSVRGYDPEFGGGHAGAGDIRITQKLRLYGGKRLQITQMLRVHTPTGNPKIGAGTGHVSLEPGLLMRWQQNCWTYWHGEVKYRIPIGGDPIYSGDVMTYGFGVSSVWHETSTTAVIPTLELTSLNFLTGEQTGFGGPIPVDGDSAVALHPGVRFAWDYGGDFGVTEFGVSSGLPISDTRYFDGFLRFELRFVR